MTDKQASSVTKKLTSLLKEWGTGANPRLLPLRGWKIQVDFNRNHSDRMGEGTVGAETNVLWQYKDARVEFFLPALEKHADLELEEVVVHELGHILVCEMREMGKFTEKSVKHEERVVTELTLAFLNTKYRDLKPEDVKKGRK